MVEKRTELLKQNGRLGVFEETAKLDQVLMWGAPGIESVLGQLLPTDISCFETQFNVPGARQEFEAAKNILTTNGVNVIQVKDLFAQMVEEKGLRVNMGLDQLKENIAKRAFEYYKKYRGQEISDIEEVLGWVDQILDEDVEKYGEETTVFMNNTLSLANQLPMSNILYARDQSNVLGGTIVWSSMRHEIRQPEVHLFKTVLRHSGLLKSGKVEEIQVNGSGKFEGGDGIANGGIYYIGVGGRTNVEGVMQAAGSILNNGKGQRLMIPIDYERDLGEKGEMDAMHLDTIWMPSDKNEIVACQDEVKRRQLLEITKTSTGLKISNIGWFADHLDKRGVDLVPLTKEEQERYAPNFLNLGDGKVVLSLADGNDLMVELGKKGKTVYNADLKNITKGFGGLHCMTASIRREML